MTNDTCRDDDRLAALFTSLTAEEHEEYPPFRWQLRLLHRLLKGDLPQAIDIPTGLGKTSVMALWLIALIEGARLPRRLVYIVDRRAVVDQATRFAERLRHNMPVEMEKRLGLKDGTGHLPISTLRGGFADNRDWMEDPSKPAIVVGTIDMIGSRLLFEGYGVSRRMRPYHAGFLGVDALILLDEAHLCPPFEVLLRQIVDHRDGILGPEPGYEPVTPSFHVMSLSATGRDLLELPSTSVFRLEGQDYEQTVIHQRLTAQKWLKVTVITDARSLPECIVERAIELGEGDTPARVLIYCHSRTDAVTVKNMIEKECKARLKSGKLTDSWKWELLVGERRIYERTNLEHWLEQHGFLGGASTSVDVPTFLVATSAGEVGVDLDADHMVCDMVAYERMVQRLGRINRRGGEHRQAMVDVFAVKPELKTNPREADREQYETDSCVFNARLAVLLKSDRREDCRHDASPSAMAKLRLMYPSMVDSAISRVPLHPVLTRSLLDAWSMTSLDRHEGRPEIAPWLRGWEDDDEPQTTVIWRKYIPSVRHGNETMVSAALIAEYFQSAPIHTTEKLEAVSGRVFDWLLKRSVQVAKRREDHDLAVNKNDIVAILIDQAGEYVDSASLNELQWLAASAKSLSKSEQRERDRRKKDWRDRHLPGRILIVDARICGLSDGLLNEKSDLRVATADADELWTAMKEDESDESSRPVIKYRIEQITASQEEEGLALPVAIEDWQHVRTYETFIDAGGAVRGGLAVFKWLDDAKDEDSRSILSVPQTLTDHAAQVAAGVRDLATRLGLPDEEVEAFSVAARMHDAGKATVRWQNAMNAPKDGRIYAKTLGGGNWRLLEGYRHEFGSLLEAEQQVLPESTRDLILHLIAVHHGFARPLISHEGCEAGPPSLLESKAGEAALRFVRLQKRYGPWGLAWREAILRAVDQSSSRESAKHHGKHENG